MNKAKGIFWLIILGFIGLLIFQNQAFFIKTTKAIELNLYFKDWKTPELSVAVYLISFFAVGFIISYLFGLYGKYKSNQVIKDLNNKIKGHWDTIAKMGEEVTALKAAAEERARENQVRESEPVEPEQEPVEIVAEPADPPQAGNE